MSSRRVGRHRMQILSFFPLRSPRSPVQSRNTDRLDSMIRHPKTSVRRRQGFTLVEMLVAVGLVILMMSMFAAVCQLATGAMSKQKGIAENDQRARLVTTVLQSDLQKRTFRHMLPFKPVGSTNDDNEFRLAERQGYFYISEN